MIGAKLLPNPEIPNALDDFWEEQVEPYLQKTSEVKVTFAVKDTPYRIRHRLAGVPSRFRIVDLDAAGSIYRVVEDLQKTDKFHTYLRCDTDGVTAVVEFI